MFDYKKEQLMIRLESWLEQIEDMSYSEWVEKFNLEYSIKYKLHRDNLGHGNVVGMLIELDFKSINQLQ